MKNTGIIILLVGIVAAGGVFLWPSNDSSELSAPVDAAVPMAVVSVKDPPSLSAAESRLQTVERLAAMGPDAVPKLAEEMRNAEKLSAKAEYADALIEIGTPEAIQAFANQWLATTTPEARRALAESLKGLHSDEGLEMVASILSLTDDRIVLDAVNGTLARMAGADTIEFLSELYKEGTANGDGTRTRVVDAVQATTNPGAIDALVSLIETGNSPELALAAADSLANIGTEAAITRLVSLIRDESETSRELYGPLLQRLETVTAPSSAAILETIAESDPSEDIRNAAANALATIQSEEQIDPDAIRASAQKL